MADGSLVGVLELTHLLRAMIMTMTMAGGNTVDVAAHQGAIVTQDLLCMVRGTMPSNPLNPEVLESFSWVGPRHGIGVEKMGELFFSCLLGCSECASFGLLLLRDVFMWVSV